MQSGSSDRSRAWTRGILLLLLAATLLNYANRFAFTQNATAIQRDFETTEAGYGQVAGRFALGFACGGLVFGILADAINIRWLSPLVVLVWSLAGMSRGWVTSLYGLGTSQFVLGLFEAGHWPCALRTTQRTFKPADRTWANSVLQSGASLGAVGTPLLVVAILSWPSADWRWIFPIVGIPGLVWAIIWLCHVQSADVQRPVIQTNEAANGLGADQELQEIPFWQVFVQRRWWVLLFVVVCINTLWHYIRVWMPVTLQTDHGYTEEFVAYFTSIYYLATFCGALASGWLTRYLAGRAWNVHRARLRVFLVFGLLASLSIPAAFLSRGPLLLAALLFVAFGSLGLFPIYYSLNQEISAKNQGKVGGSLGFSTWSILFLVHPAIGAWVDADPTIRPYLFAGVGVGPLLAYLVLRFCWGQRPELTTARSR